MYFAFSGVARVAEHPDGDDPADALPGPLGALHCHGQGRPGKRVEVGSIAALSKETAPLRCVCVPRSASSGNLTRWRFTETSLTPITRLDSYLELLLLGISA